MIVLEILFWIIVIMCVVYYVFRPMDIISWWWTKSKNVYKKVLKMIQRWF